MKHIPNILSAFRIVLIPFFVWQFMIGNTYIAGGILLLSGLTDLLDGNLARRFGWISALGKVLDPVADKMTMVAVCIVMILRLPGLWPFFVVLLGKDLIMLLLGGYLMKKGIKLEGAKWFGKIATFLFYGTTILIVFIPGMPRALIITLLALTTVCALVSAIMYIPEYFRYLRESKEEKADDKLAQP